MILHGSERLSVYFAVYSTVYCPLYCVLCTVYCVTLNGFGRPLSGSGGLSMTLRGFLSGSAWVRVAQRGSEWLSVALSNSEWLFVASCVLCSVPCTVFSVLSSLYCWEPGAVNGVLCAVHYSVYCTAWFCMYCPLYCGEA